MLTFVACVVALIAIGVSAIAGLVTFAVCRRAILEHRAAEEKIADANARRDRAIELLNESEATRDRDRREFLTRLETWQSTFSDAVGLYREAIAAVTAVAPEDLPKPAKPRIQ